VVIRQGDVYWIDLGPPGRSGPGYLHPHVVVQNNLFNRTRIGTVVVCAITSNLMRGEAPGNVLLDQGEANLPKRSVVNISQIFTVDKDELIEKIGSLSSERVEQIYAGLDLLLTPRDLELSSQEADS
jgi:mRNA interferase MazF